MTQETDITEDDVQAYHANVSALASAWRLNWTAQPPEHQTEPVAAGTAAQLAAEFVAAVPEGAAFAKLCRVARVGGDAATPAPVLRGALVGALTAVIVMVGREQIGAAG